jgi:hypothetical protein
MRLHAFLTSLRYYLHGWGLVWKMEFGKENGRIHFHLLLLPPQDAQVAWVEKSLIDRLWQWGFTWLEKVDQGRIRGYLIKYSVKGWGPGFSGDISLDQSRITEENSGALGEGVGRFWGIRWTIVWCSERLVGVDYLRKFGVLREVEIALAKLIEYAKSNGFVVSSVTILLSKQITD